MIKPNYCLKIYKENFNAQTVCLGSQLVIILNVISKIMPELYWCVCDIDTNLIGNYSLGYGSSYLKKIGSVDKLVSIVSPIGQFFSGVFMAFNSQESIFDDIEYFTEDDSYRDIGNAIIEIRAFDTSYFEIYSNDQELIEFLSSSLSIKSS